MARHSIFYPPAGVPGDDFTIGADQARFESFLWRRGYRPRADDCGSGADYGLVEEFLARNPHAEPDDVLMHAAMLGPLARAGPALRCLPDAFLFARDGPARRAM
jgi:hypothetical protein